MRIEVRTNCESIPSVFWIRHNNQGPYLHRLKLNQVGKSKFYADVGGVGIYLTKNFRKSGKPYVLWYRTVEIGGQIELRKIGPNVLHNYVDGKLIGLIKDQL